MSSRCDEEAYEFVVEERTTPRASGAECEGPGERDAGVGEAAEGDEGEGEAVLRGAEESSESTREEDIVGGLVSFLCAGVGLVLQGGN